MNRANIKRDAHRCLKLSRLPGIDGCEYCKYENDFLKCHEVIKIKRQLQREESNEDLTTDSREHQTDQGDHN